MKVKVLSRVQLFVTPWIAAHQAPPSMGFSRQEYWSGVPYDIKSRKQLYKFILKFLSLKGLKFGYLDKTSKISAELQVLHCFVNRLGILHDTQNIGQSMTWTLAYITTSPLMDGLVFSSTCDTRNCFSM